uniref:Ig-like domain-containing protein n=1 Tax=Suricata suricatta TaxID=37032 RepID=A0A673TVV2_SURSU
MDILHLSLLFRLTPALHHSCPPCGSTAPAHTAESYLTPDPSEEFMFDFDGDEIFHTDMEKETVYPGIGQYRWDKANLDIMIKHSNHTPNTNAKSNFCHMCPLPPEVTVLSNVPVELGEPNILICFTDKFFPTVINVTWLEMETLNGNPVTTGVPGTVFLPRKDCLFHRFHYLPFLPSTEDVYDCKVEHWSWDEPLLKRWEFDAPTPLPETTENVVCALGLVVGLVGMHKVNAGNAEGLCESSTGGVNVVRGRHI